MLTRIYSIAKKEIRQVLRDPVTLIIIFFFPVFMLVLFGYALNFDVENIQLGVFDQEKSETSRNLINSIKSSGYFNVVTYYNNQDEVTDGLDKKEVQCILVIPNDLSMKLNTNRSVKLQYLIDGINGNTATIIMNYVNAVTTNLSSKYFSEVISKKGLEISLPIDYRPVFWFNPELKTTPFLLTGLIASILVTLAVVLTAIAIVREKELGTIEQLYVSPLSSPELILGKIFPYTILSLIIAAIIIIAGHLIFGMEIKGSKLLLLLSTLIYLVAALCMGIFVSTVSESQQVAFQLGTLISQLPSNLLSGFIFPIESMPDAIKILTNITPAKFYIVSLRSVLIKDAGLDTFWEQLVYMIIFAMIFIILSSFKLSHQKQSA